MTVRTCLRRLAGRPIVLGSMVEVIVVFCLYLCLFLFRSLYSEAAVLVPAVVRAAKGGRAPFTIAGAEREENEEMCDVVIWGYDIHRGTRAGDAMQRTLT